MANIQDLSTTILDTPSSGDGDAQSIQIDVRTARIENMATGDDNVYVAEPPTPTHSQYPYNDSHLSLSGHLIEIDDTPGAERLLDQHKAGTFLEVHPDGSRVTKIFGKDFYIVLDEHNLFVAGNLNITCQSNVNLLVKGNMKSKIGGNFEQIVLGNMVTRVSGTTTHYSKGDIDIQTAGNLRMRSALASAFVAATKITIGAPDVSLSATNSSTFNTGSGSIGVSGGVATISGDTVNIRATNQLTTWGTHVYSNPSATSSVVPAPALGPTPAIPYIAKKDIGPGLTIPDSLISPSVDSMLAVRTDNNNLVDTLPTGITYPKDRKPIVE